MFSRHKRPSGAKYSQSCLPTILSHQNFLDYCYKSSKIQEYWRLPEYMVYPINEAMQQPVPIVTSNINPGDFFTVGKSPEVMIAMVTSKITIMQGMLKPEQWKPSPHKEGGDYLVYEIDGDIGGFNSQQPHKELASGFFYWLPLPYQLMTIGFTSEAEDLQDILRSVTANNR